MGVKILGSERGYSKVTNFFLIVVIALGIYVAWIVAPPFMHNSTIKGNMKEALREVVKYMDENETRYYLMKKLDLWGIRYNPETIYVWDEEGYRHVEMTYSEPITFFGQWTFELTFHPKIAIKLLRRH